MISVAVDLTPVITGRTGIALLVRELVAALAVRGVDVRGFAVGRAQQRVPDDVRHLRLPARLVHRSWALGGPPRPERLVGPVDVVHATGLIPPTTTRPLVSTVHDLAALEHPELHSPRQVAQMGALSRHLRRADVIVVDSGAIGDTLRATGFDPDRIVVAYPGIPGLGEPVGGRVVDDPYLLAVGEQMPRKGLPVLLEAFARADVDDLVLVHAGPPSPYGDELRQQVGRLGIADRVRFLGYVERPTLAALYRDAVALCFPSVAEGFGFPVLEALALGTPVVASDIPPVCEIAGHVAELVTVGDVEKWAEAIISVVVDSSIRARVGAAGPAAAARFTWDECAAATEVAYRRAIELAGVPRGAR